jgi:hypothetical protein
VQIIEVTGLGARSAVLRLRRRGSPMEFVIFPMVHFADAQFYQSVQKRLGDCQIVVAEGIQGRSASTRAITRSYRLLRHKKSLGMVVQNLDYGALNAEIIYPDLTGAEMDRGWEKIPLRQRLQTTLLIPIFMLWMLCFGTRQMLAQQLAMDDLPTPKQEAAEDAIRKNFGETEKLVVDRRDAMLLDALTRLHNEHHEDPIKVAIVYGAGHVTTVVRALHQRFGYTTRSADWLELMKL